MKIPQIVTTNKIRDARICSLYADGKSAEEIAELFKLTSRRISTILYKNREFLKSDKDWEKTKRIHHLRRLIAKAGESKKDVADLIDQLRVETEGNKLEHSGTVEHNHFYNEIIVKPKLDRVGVYASDN
jgi:hypothetical protein